MTAALGKLPFGQKLPKEKVEQINQLTRHIIRARCQLHEWRVMQPELTRGAKRYTHKIGLLQQKVQDLEVKRMLLFREMSHE